MADGLHNVGQLHQLEHWAKAEALYREALALRRKIYGPDNPMAAQTLRNLGDLALEREPGRAEAFFREALRIDRKALPENDHRLANSLVGLGRAALWRRDYGGRRSLLPRSGGDKAAAPAGRSQPGRSRRLAWLRQRAARPGRRRPAGAGGGGRRARGQARRGPCPHPPAGRAQ